MLVKGASGNIRLKARSHSALRLDHGHKPSKSGLRAANDVISTDVEFKTRQDAEKNLSLNTNLAASGLHDVLSNHQPRDFLLNRLFRRRSKKTPKLRVTGLCAGKSPGTGEFPAQMASNAENVSIWWRHHGTSGYLFGPKCVICAHVTVSLPFNYAIENYHRQLYRIQSSGNTNTRDW